MTRYRVPSRSHSSCSPRSASTRSLARPVEWRGRADGPLRTPSDRVERPPRANTRLLDAELPSPRFVHERYLRWLYEENPHGTKDSARRRRGRRACRCRMCEFPQGIPRRAAARHRACSPSTPSPARERSARATSAGSGSRSTWRPTSGDAVADRRLELTSRSAWWSSRAGWRHWGPLPCVWVVPLGVSGRGIEHHLVDASSSPPTHAAQRRPRLGAGRTLDPTSPHYLRWRLTCPTAQYWVHVMLEPSASRRETTASASRPR